MTMNTFTKFAAVALSTVLAVISIGLAPAATSIAKDLAKDSALEKKVIQNVQKASVQLGPVAMMKDKSGKQVLRFFGWGSGTIVSSDGFILTNNHVADTSSLTSQVKKSGGKLLADKLVVLITKRSDQPPVASFVATAVLYIPKLDLAVLKITHDLSGQEIDASELNLSFVPMGNSDELELGDNINIFGYPGIGGDTITFTQGPVSGFARDPNVDGRGWIKTSASISGGNSGGTGVNDAGELIGVPTRGGAGEAESIVDCRPVTDTNNDGSVDEGDSCVPIGGFINSLRPVNVARPFVGEAANMEPGETKVVEEVTPNPDPQPEPKPEPAEGVIITGKIVDASTGRAIPNAVFVILKPGINWENTSGDEEDILESVATDRKGYFETTQPIARGEPYSMGVGAKGYKTIFEDDITLADDTADTIEVTFKLQKK
jgi:S1-C subfamily serine protease